MYSTNDLRYYREKQKEFRMKDKENGIIKYTVRIPKEAKDMIYTIAQALMRGNRVKYVIEGDDFVPRGSSCRQDRRLSEEYKAINS